MDSQALQRRAEDIANQYLASVPGDYNGRYSEIAEPAVIAAILDGISRGMRDKDACEAAGIHPRTLQRWQDKAADAPDTAYAAFVRELKEARQQRKKRLLKKIEDAGDKDPRYWVAHAWLLERTEQQEFALQKDKADGPTVVFQVGVKDGDVVINQLSPPQTQRVGEGA